MYDQIREDILFILLYGVVTATAVIACCYLLFRRANAFAPDVTSSVRLRRWTGAFFAFIALNHMWYMPIFFQSSNDDIVTTDLVGALLDSITFIPLTIGVLFVMLQDRRRPLWPIAVMVAPIIAGNVWSVAERNYALLPILQVYFLLMCIGLFTYMVLALRQYGHWLRENFADLEHKEVWQSFVMLAVMLLMLFIYALTNEGPAYLYEKRQIPECGSSSFFIYHQHLRPLDLGRFTCKEHRAVAEAALRGAATLFTIQSLSFPTCHNDWCQPLVPQQALCLAGHLLQCVHQRSAHPALCQSLP